MQQAQRIERGTTQIGTRLRAIARTLRQRRRVRLGVRAVWIALVVWNLGLVGALLGWSVSMPLLLGVAVTVLLIGWLYAWLSHPSLTRLAHGLDQRYALAQQLTTALEVGRHTPTTSVEAQLIAETDSLLVRMRRYFAAQPLVPWRELETLIAMALLAVGLTIAAGPLLPQAIAPIALPDLPAPEVPTDTAQATPTEQPVAEQELSPPPLSPEAQAAADAIADALRDNGATSSAAEALDRGDPQEAASQLRELADQADQLSDQAREDIAEGLRGAAEQLGETQPGLADQLEQQADALERGGQEAAQALEDLARTVDQLGEQGEQSAQAQPSPGDQSEQTDPSGQQPGDQAGQQPGDQAGGGPGAGNQLGGEQRGAQPSEGQQPQGEDIPLPSPPTTDGPTTNATGPKGPTIELGSGGTGQTNNQGSGGGSDQPLGGEADPLAIPSEYRDVVEDYFSPDE